MRVRSRACRAWWGHTHCVRSMGGARDAFAQTSTPLCLLVTDLKLQGTGEEASIIQASDAIIIHSIATDQPQ